MQSLIVLFSVFLPFHPPLPSSKLTPPNTDRWIPANSVRRFVLKYQCPAGDSQHASICFCFTDPCLLPHLFLSSASVAHFHPLSIHLILSVLFPLFILVCLFSTFLRKRWKKMLAKSYIKRIWLYFKPK